MFDITPDEIARLNDIDLRELVGRLCEAEVLARGLSTSAVTWGGNQTAPDGGLDVRVTLANCLSIDGFVPRGLTGFQVKTPDMPRAKILAEMRPSGAIRPVIQDLADAAGAYIVVSSQGSTADRTLLARQNALREALDDVPNADQLHTDFYDRTRLATWVRRFPGLITWVKERVGRALVGWHPYGPWAGAGDDAEYLLDEKLRLHMGKRIDVPAQSIAQAIDELRDELAQPGRVVRLVGLSGVGKTRLAQALFDARLGSRPLSPSLAVYANLSDEPNPQPIGLASDMLASNMRAVLIADNCPPDLHHRLAELCSKQNSSVSVLTIEYDIRDDQPERTKVVTLDTSSAELIERLVGRRYSHLSRVDIHAIAEASGGNARIAIALAETVERSDSIAGLSNDELFQRLFRQRHEPDNALYVAAQACALVYSLEGETLSGAEAELGRIAALAGQAPAEMYRHIGELLRRNLMQQRGVWRAVLPHAIANRLAARALEIIPYVCIEQNLIQSGSDRLARSFSRRLSYLHEHPTAERIVQSWLAPAGLLGQPESFNELGMAMFENVAPVSPESALSALERIGVTAPDIAASSWHGYLSLLRLIAYDPSLFERSVELLARAAVDGRDDQSRKQASDTFVSLFKLYLSGTHATIEQRLRVVEKLLRSTDGRARQLGLAALANVLQAIHFHASHGQNFGARSRDYGYQPQNRGDEIQWYSAALSMIERLALDERVLNTELLRLLGDRFRSLWTWAGMYSELEALSIRIAINCFWLDGWVGCRQVICLDGSGFPSDLASRLSALEVALRPSILADKARAVIRGDGDSWTDLDELDAESDEMWTLQQSEALAIEVGAAVAVATDVLAQILPDLLRGGTRAWAFGRGIARASSDIPATWKKLVGEAEQTPRDELDVHLLMGFLAELWESDRELAQQLLDATFSSQALLPFLPLLNSSVALDDRGVERMKRALCIEHVPIRMFEHLAYGRATAQLEGQVLWDLLDHIAARPDGYYVALDILHMRIFADQANGRLVASELLEAGRELLRRVTLRNRSTQDDYNLGQLVKLCLAGPDAALVATDAVLAVRRAVESQQTYAFDCADFLLALAAAQPMAVLDALFGGDEEQREAAVRDFEHIVGHQPNWTDAISPEVLTAWCAEDPIIRFPLAASVVTFARRTDGNQPIAWSEHAAALLAAAPNAQKVLNIFIERFWPTSWSGSRAAIAEENARLLDSNEVQALAEAREMVLQAKAELARTVIEERQWETKRDRGRDGRFE